MTGMRLCETREGLAWLTLCTHTERHFPKSREINSHAPDGILVLTLSRKLSPTLCLELGYRYRQDYIMMMIMHQTPATPTTGDHRRARSAGGPWGTRMLAGINAGAMAIANCGRCRLYCHPKFTPPSRLRYGVPRAGARALQDGLPQRASATGVSTHSVRNCKTRRVQCRMRRS